MGDDVKSRLQAFIKHLNISERDFCQSIRVSHSYVQNMGSKINVATRNKITAAYPLLSIDWLLTGSGSMLLDEPAPPVALPEEKKVTPVAAPANNDISLRLLALVESQQRTLADNAATIKRQTEELAALRSQIEALTKEELKDVAEVSPSFRRAPSPADSLV